MTVTRPKIFEPSIRVYDKPIHPEFFQIVASKRILREKYEVSLSITHVGHVLQWRSLKWHGGGHFLTEVVSANVCQLPDSAIIYHSLSGHESGPLVLPENKSKGLSYKNSCRIEELPTEVFRVFEKEFLCSMDLDCLMFRFGHTGRAPLGATGFIGVNSFRNRLRVRAFHTFPDDCVLLNSESIILMDADTD